MGTPVAATRPMGPVQALTRFGVAQRTPSRAQIPSTSTMSRASGPDPPTASHNSNRPAMGAAVADSSVSTTVSPSAVSIGMPRPVVSPALLALSARMNRNEPPRSRSRIDARDAQAPPGRPLPRAKLVARDTASKSLAAP